MKIIIKEVGHYNQVSFAGYHDVPEDRDCEECESRATQSRVVGKRDDSCNSGRKVIRFKIISPLARA